jgi:hypothetical protein
VKPLPESSALAYTILNTPVNKKKTLAVSEDFLVSKRSYMQSYQGFEHFFTAQEVTSPSDHKAIEYHMVQLRAQLARELWGCGLFIGVSVLDELLFRAVVEESNTPVLRTLELIRDNELHYPGFVVFPIHSFGILGAGLLQWSTNNQIDFTSSEFGVVMAPQTNSLDATIDLLKRACQAFEIDKQVSDSLVKHWYQSRSTFWLTRNPLLIVKTQSFPGEYYENQFLLLSKLRQATALVTMLSALQPMDEEQNERIWSSSSLNNFQTLDIHHYLVFFNSPRDEAQLHGSCVPMHLSQPALAELSDLGIELDARHWQEQSSIATRVYSAVNTVHEGYLRYSVGSNRDSLFARVYRKLFETMSFFRRSFHRSDMNWSAVVSLAVAFEMLLTDGYAPNIKSRVVRRTQMLLGNINDATTMQNAVEDLYIARGAIVHNGSTKKTVNLPQAQRAFVHVFVAMAEALPKLSQDSNAPMKDLSGDTLAEETNKNNAAPKCPNCGLNF